jgi:glycosyltransferase involved in cell wall biosynthesis
LSYSLSTILFLIFESQDRPILVLTNPPFLPFACLVARLFRPKLRFALLVFDVYPDTAIQQGLLSQDGWMARMWEWLNTWSFRSAKKVIVIGRCMKDVLMAKGNRSGLDLAPKLEMIHIWADDQMIKGAEVRFPAVFQNRDLEGKFIVLYSGNMGRFHDMETLLKAAIILKGHPCIRFAFIGEGAKKEEVLDTIRQHQLENCIIDTYVPKEELGHLLRSAHVGVATLMPGQEGLSVPSKTLGLMAAGIPIIAVMSPASEIAMLVKENGLGVVLAPGEVERLVETLEHLFAHSELCQSMGAAGAAIVQERLSLEQAAQAYSHLLCGL